MKHANFFSTIKYQQQQQHTTENGDMLVCDESWIDLLRVHLDNDIFECNFDVVSSEIVS